MTAVVAEPRARPLGLRTSSPQLDERLGGSGIAADARPSGQAGGRFVASWAYG